MARQEHERVPPCCNAKIDASRGDGVTIGSCGRCQKNVIRINPETGQEEWLDGHSPWTDQMLRPVTVN